MTLLRIREHRRRLCGNLRDPRHSRPKRQAELHVHRQRQSVGVVAQHPRRYTGPRPVGVPPEPRPVSLPALACAFPAAPLVHTNRLLTTVCLPPRQLGHLTAPPQCAHHLVAAPLMDQQTAKPTAADINAMMRMIRASMLAAFRAPRWVGSDSPGFSVSEPPLPVTAILPPHMTRGNPCGVATFLICIDGGSSKLCFVIQLPHHDRSPWDVRSVRPAVRCARWTPPAKSGTANPG